MPDAEILFTEHVKLVREHVGLSLSEADTRAYLVDPVLRILGYETVGDLRREVSVPATKESLDYALLVDGKPHVIVEAKPVQQGVADQHAAQCVQYAAVLGVRWCLVTNGRQWALYDAYAKVALAEKRIIEVRLDTDDAAAQRAWKVLQRFSKQQQTTPNPLTDLLVERVVVDELGRSDSGAVDALRQAVKKRFGEAVKSTVVLSTLKRLLEGNTSMASVPPGADTPPIRSKAAPPGPSAVTPAPKKGGKRVVLSDLIQASLLPNGAVLDLRVHGVTHVGHIKEKGIEVDGILYLSPSAAAAAVTGRASNGWRDWSHKGETLDQLRTRLPTVQS